MTSRSGIDLRMTLLPQKMKLAGYKTAMTGKVRILDGPVCCIYPWRRLHVLTTYLFRSRARARARSRSRSRSRSR